jgi:coenzyme F420-reducing hydrogenase beta subunit
VQAFSIILTINFLCYYCNDFILKNGQLIIGNFSPLNPTIKVMEVRTEWYENYRNEVQQKSLAKNAEIIDSKIKGAKEPLGINLFLQIQSYG